MLREWQNQLSFSRFKEFHENHDGMISLNLNAMRMQEVVWLDDVELKIEAFWASISSSGNSHGRGA